MSETQSAIRTALEHIDSISHKITDGEYKNIVDSLQTAYRSAGTQQNFNIFNEDTNEISDNWLAGIPPFTDAGASIDADRTLIEEFLTIGDLYSLSNRPSNELHYRFIGFSPPDNSVEFRHIFTDNIHRYPLGSRTAIWNRIEL